MLKTNKEPLNLTLNISLLTLFAILFIVTLAMIIMVFYLLTGQILLNISQKELKRTSELAQEKLVNLIQPTAASSRLSGTLIQNNVVNAKIPQEVLDYTTTILKNLPRAMMVYWSDEQGDFVIARRLENGHLQQQIINRSKKPNFSLIIELDAAGKILSRQSQPITAQSYDPRKRFWYEKAKTAKKLIWSDAYHFFTGGGKTIGLTASTPVYQQGKLIGVFGIDLTLNSLSDFLKNLKIGKHGIAFIIDDHGKLITSPLISIPALTNITQLKKNLVKDAFFYFKKVNLKNFSFNFNHQAYLSSFQSLQDFSDRHWLLAITVPENDFIGDLNYIITFIIFSGIISACLGLFLIFLISKKISASVEKLAGEMSKVESLRLHEVKPVYSHITEIIALNKAFTSMCNGLRAFQKYVNQDIVKETITTGKEVVLGGKKSSITILFTDIENFTNITENTAADELVDHLCAYYDVLSEIIMRHKGTIDKYIGDAIMAFWGSPVPDSQQQIHACQAAVEIQKQLSILNQQWSAAGKPIFATRIGIHCGEAIVGNIGSKDKLNYTAMGDAINMASRLESLNKIYGTNTIVSEAIVERLEQKFMVRILDKIAVKGKKQGALVYELIALKEDEIGTEAQNFIEQYNTAFSLYQQQQFAEAILLIENLLKTRPHDLSLMVLMEHCKKMLLEKDLSHWDGVWRYDTK